jgi:putative FmdB family regulatory protein
MPVYDYKCNSCDEHFEAKLAMKEVGEKKVPCPGCGVKDTQRVIGAVSFNITRPLLSHARRAGLREDFYEKAVEDRKEKKRSSGDDSPPANEAVVNQALNEIVTRGL